VSNKQEVFCNEARLKITKFSWIFGSATWRVKSPKIITQALRCWCFHYDMWRKQYW